MSQINKNTESTSSTDNFVELLIRQMQNGPTFEDILRLQSNNSNNKDEVEKFQKNLMIKLIHLIK